MLATIASFAGFTNRRNVPGRQPGWAEATFTVMRKTFVITFHRQHHPVPKPDTGARAGGGHYTATKL